MFVLVVIAGPRSGARFELDRPALIGRGDSADVDLFDPSVSRRHALISLGEGGCRLSDLQSGNGTYLNGREIVASMLLRDGDLLQLGESRLEYRDRVETMSKGTLSLPPESVEVDARTGTMAIPIVRSPASATGALSLDSERQMLKRRLEFFGDVAEILSRTIEIGPLLQAILRQVMDALPQADRACVARFDETTGEFADRVALRRSGETVDIQVSLKMWRSAVEKRQVVLVGDARTEDSFPGKETLRLLGVRSVLCLPLVVANTVFGVLQVDSAIEGKPFGVDDLHAMAGVGPSIALAIANAGLHRQLLAHELEMHDLELARRVQRQFLPEASPQVPGYRFAFRYTPALAVGGDVYDFLPLESGRLGVAVGDVSGKGVSAALLMARVMSDIRFLAGQGLSPAEVIERLSRLLASSTREAMFTTLLYLEMEPASGTLELVNAGHLRPLLRQTDGRVVAIDLPAGLPAGVEAHTKYRSRPARLGVGEALLLFTDGVTEAVAPNGERFGEDRLRQVMAKADGEPEAIAAAVVAAIEAFTQGGAAEDDLTLVCLFREAFRKP